MNRILSSLMLIVALVFVACGPAAPSGSPGSVAPPAPSPEASSAASTAPSAAAGGGQTDTAWGRIWDTLPSSFPQIPGARPADDAAAGPASGTFVIAGDVSRLVATALVTQLAGAGYPTAGLGTPLEDGSYTLDATGSTAGCKVQLTLTPMGGETFVTILYGAACPHD